METTITTKGQVVIPVEIRRRHGIKAGTRFDVTDDDRRIILTPVTPAYVRSLKGILKGKQGLKILTEERNREKDRP